MYYLNEDGKRVYTLKVRLFLILLAFVWISLSLFLSLSCFRCFIKTNCADRIRSLTQFSSLSSLPAAPKIEFRKPLRMGSRRFPRTRRDSPRTISFLSRESRVRKGLVYSPRSSRRNNIKPNTAFSKKPSIK